MEIKHSSSTSSNDIYPLPHTTSALTPRIPKSRVSAAAKPAASANKHDHTSWTLSRPVPNTVQTTGLLKSVLGFKSTPTHPLYILLFYVISCHANVLTPSPLTRLPLQFRYHTCELATKRRNHPNLLPK